MGWLSKIFSGKGRFEDRVASDLLALRVEEGSHPAFSKMDEIESLGARELRRQPEWLLVEALNAVHDAQRRNPSVARSVIVEQAELLLSRKYAGDPDRFAEIRARLGGANDVDGLKRYVRYRVEVSKPGALDESSFDRLFTAAWQRVSTRFGA